MRAQRVETVAGGRRAMNPRWTRERVGNRNRRREIALVEHQRHGHVIGEALLLFAKRQPLRIIEHVYHEQHTIRARELRLRATNAFALYIIWTIAKTGCVENMQWH